MKYCTDCKHFVSVQNVAHQNQCNKFKSENEPTPCAVVRADEDKCGADAKAFEAE